MHLAHEPLALFQRLLLPQHLLALPQSRLVERAPPASTRAVLGGARHLRALPVEPLHLLVGGRVQELPRLVQHAGTHLGALRVAADAGGPPDPAAGRAGVTAVGRPQAARRSSPRPGRAAAQAEARRHRDALLVHAAALGPRRPLDLRQTHGARHLGRGGTLGPGRRHVAGGARGAALHQRRVAAPDALRPRGARRARRGQLARGVGVAVEQLVVAIAARGPPGVPQTRRPAQLAPAGAGQGLRVGVRLGEPALAGAAQRLADRADEGRAPLVLVLRSWGAAGHARCGRSR
mmetsp:Transcript_102111/g.264043  ORF Transcript_102111/g.264043 Transcript_102111/m.264043 type:complete len:291 (-) Transcript_102111:409-1281(-)